MSLDATDATGTAAMPAGPRASSGGGRLALLVVGAIAATVLFAAGVISLLAGPSPGAPGSTTSLPANQLVGTRLAGFTLEGTAGAPVLAPWTEGHGAVLLFFADWCDICHTEMPRLAPVVSAGTFGSVQVIGLDGDPSLGMAASFASASHLRFPVGWDQGEALASRLTPAGFPASVVVDARGVVRAVHYGALSPAQLRVEVADARSSGA